MQYLGVYTSQSAQGGDFWQGFISQGLTHYTGSVYKMNRLMGDSLEGSTAMSAALGGTISSLSGGSFTSLRLFKRCYSIAPKLAKSKNAFCQNGAMTAAFAHLYNDSLHYDHSRKKLQHLDDDGNLVDEWDAISGYGGKKVLAEGEYALRGNLVPGDAIKKGLPDDWHRFSKDGYTFFQGISDAGGMTGLGIHPDGNVPWATDGCIGLQNGHQNVYNLFLQNRIDKVTVSH